LTEMKVVPLGGLQESPYKLVLCYPKFSDREFEKRISELSGLGVSALRFQGSKEIFGTKVLGKGCVGIVVSAFRQNERVAVKILRTDAGRSSLEHEASMLKLANSVDVGPKLIDVSESFLVMEYVEGLLLPDWLRGLKGRGKKRRLQETLRALLEACYRLDQIGLDHGELSRAPKHVIVNAQDQPTIVDFETASNHRRPSNVTSISQYLFVGSDLSKLITRITGPIRRSALMTSLKQYKKDRNVENFQEIIRTVIPVWR
jgi:putative serine/threonine protein kinase